VSTAVVPPPANDVDTVADLLHQLGDIPPERVLWNPRPGSATEEDLVALVEGANKRLVELVDGTLVEKPMGYYEGRVGLLIGYFIEQYLEKNDIGICFGDNSPFRYRRGVVRLPDVSYFSWSHFPNRELPAGPIAGLGPDLAVEVLSKSNTHREMERKRRECFDAGAKLFWQVDPETQTAEAYTSVEQKTEVPADGVLDGGNVLPGFQLSLKKLFERAGKRQGR